MIKNGRPYSIENGSVDDELITDEPIDIQKRVFNWIDENIIPRKTVNDSHTSYGIKHMLERQTNIYLTNNQFKDAMMIKGYFPSNENKINWCYRISQKSPAIVKYYGL